MIFIIILNLFRDMLFVCGFNIFFLMAIPRLNHILVDNLLNISFVEI